MPFTKDGIQPDLIMNPHAITSRMTIGQLFECVLSKTSALQGKITDATPFNKIDIEQVNEIFKKYGYDDNGLETLYCGMTGKKMKVKIFIGPTYYLRLKHMVNDKIHCLTLDHEVLTLKGWKKYEELTMDDEIATLKKDTGNLEYHKPKKILYYPEYQGKMYEIKNGSVNLNVTLNHRMVTSEDGITYNYEYAGDVAGEQRYYRSDANNRNKEYKFHTNTFDPDGELNKLTIGIKFGIIHKLPDWYVNLSMRQSQTIIDNIFFKDKCRTYNKVLVDQLQHLALQAGFSAKVYEENGLHKICLNNNDNRPLVNDGSLDHYENIYDFKGAVFCLEVPNETFYVRRNGIPVWTANSRSRGPRQLITHQPPEGRALNGGLRFGEMERDAMIGHGAAQFLKERLVDTSDIYDIHVCNKCGIIATKVINKEAYYCTICNGTEISKVTLPYAFKLLQQELMAINILPKIQPEINKYTTQS